MRKIRSCKFRTRKSENFWNATIWFIALSIWEKVTVYQCGQPSSVKPSGVYEKWPQSNLIVSCPVKYNQPNQTVKKFNETCFVALFRMQTYEGDKSGLHQKVSRYVRIGGQEEQWTHLRPIVIARLLTKLKPAPKKNNSKNHVIKMKQQLSL